MLVLCWRGLVKDVFLRPGGDKIGRRRLDTHFEGFIRLGAKFRYNKEDSFYGVEAEELHGALYCCLDQASVTGTANVLMAAVLATGTTTEIYNAACEPYIQQLSKMLNLWVLISLELVLIY